jgi:D-inositol-3-phosphate glycosyltransferase
MKFGTLLMGQPPPFWSKGETSMLYGVNVASMNFLRSLLSYGSFDEYHFFVSSSDPEEAKRGWNELLKPISDKAKVRDLFEIRYALLSEEFTVFHGDPFSPNPAYLRAQFGEKPFPVTSIIATISYQFIMSEILLMLLKSPLYPFDSIICTSTAAREALMNLFDQIYEELEKKFHLKIRYPGRFDVIPLGIDTEIFRPRDKKDARKLLSLPLDSLIILCFARFSAHDKMDLLPFLRCFRKILDECPHLSSNLLLLLAGEDKRYHYAQEVERFARDLEIIENVAIRTNPSFTEQPLIYSASDIFVSFSDNFQESFGITILEAMASGLPLVVSDWDGYKDTVTHGETGFRVPTYWADCEGRISTYSPICDWRLEHLFLAQSVCVDMNEMTKYLLLLVEHPELRDELGRNARKVAQERYDWRVIIEQYEELWRELYEQAQSFNGSPEERLVLRPSRLATFRGYPSSIIDLDTRIHTTPYGNEVLNKKKSLKYYSGMKNVLLFPVIQDILKMALDEKPMEEIEHELLLKYRDYSLTSQDVRYQVMWLLKHGLLRVSYPWQG